MITRRGDQCPSLKSKNVGVCDCVCNDWVLEDTPIAVCELDCWKEVYDTYCFNKEIKTNQKKLNKEEILKLWKPNIRNNILIYDILDMIYDITWFNFTYTYLKL